MFNRRRPAQNWRIRLMESENAIRVSVVEDNDRYRASLTVLLEGSPGFRCAGTHRTAEAALAHIPEEKPDVGLMDIELPKRTGIESAWSLRQRMPEVPIMMLTAYDDPEKIFKS